MLDITDDNQWFKYNLNPNTYTGTIAIPETPPEDIQMRFTGLSGERNLRQAFTFYKYIQETYVKRENVRIMDFGAGWGRISRFFLRETDPNNIYLVDCMQESLKWMSNTKNPCNKVLCNPYPPIVSETLKEPIDIIYAFSVFSHLSEQYFIGWINEFANHLHDDGVIVFTTRNKDYLNYLVRLKNEEDKSKWPPHLHKMGDLDTVRDDYDKGKFIFVPFSGGDELTDKFFGEAYFSQKYIESILDENNLTLVDVKPDLQDLNQTVFTLKKKKIA